MSKNIFHVFTKWDFEKFTNRMNGGYEMIWKLSYGNQVHVSDKSFLIFKISPNHLLAFLCK